MGKIRIILIPGITHRRMNIANMKGIRPWNDAFRHTVRARYYKIIFLKVKKFSSQRKQRKIMPKFFLQEWQTLYKARSYFPFFNLFNLASRKMEESIDRSFRKDFSKYFKNLFSPTPHREPVMYQGNSCIFHCG